METSVKRRSTTLLCGIALMGAVGAHATNEELPDLDFLEYLGMWEESDEDWQLLQDNAVADNEKRSDPVPTGEESTETENES